MPKVRYHLQKGPNYLHWQFKNDETVFYMVPELNTIRLKNCVLHNNRKTANKIFLGANKDVCAWIKYGEMETMPTDYMDNFDIRYRNTDQVIRFPSFQRINYNPKSLPFWNIIGPEGVQNVDGTHFDELFLGTFCGRLGVYFSEVK